MNWITASISTWFTMMDIEDRQPCHVRPLHEIFPWLREGHGLRAAVAHALLDIYGRRGPKGVKAKDLLNTVNRRLEERKQSRISMSTLRRARKKRFGW